MAHRDLFLVLCALAGGLASCAPEMNSGDDDVDAIVDLVVSREAPFHGCVDMQGRSSILKTGAGPELAPIGGLNVDALQSEAAQRAAEKIAVAWEDALQAENDLSVKAFVGSPDSANGECAMKVGEPVLSDDYAFIDFSSPGGEVGSYALKRAQFGWSVEERFVWGYW